MASDIMRTQQMHAAPTPSLEVQPMPACEEDGELLARVAQRQDPAAFALLLGRHQEALLGLASYLTRNQDSAEDAIQAALLLAWRHAGRFEYRGDGSVRAWLLRLTANESIRLARNSGREARRIERAEARKPEPPRFPAETSAERRELFEALRAGLDELSGVEREVVGLYFGAELDQRAIAKHLNLSQQAVSYKLRHTLEKLRAGLAQSGFSGALVLLETPQLGDIFQTWAWSSPTLARRIVEALPRQQRPAPRSYSASWGAAVGAAVVLAAGISVAVVRLVPAQTEPPGPASNSGFPTPAMPRAPAPPADAVTTGVRQDVFRMRWDFDARTGWQVDLALSDRNAWAANGGVNDSGCLRTTQPYTSLFIRNVPTDRLPLRVRFKQQLLSTPMDRLASVKCGWSDASMKVCGVFFNAGIMVYEAREQPAWRQIECYLSERFMDTWLDGKRSNIEYVELLESRQLLLGFTGQFRMDDLEIDQIAPGAIPDVGRYLTAVGAIPPEARNSSLYALPGLPSPRPGKSVFLRFFSCPGWAAKGEPRSQTP